MALVVIVAVPILMGYGLNIQADTTTVWSDDGNPAHATPYLADITDVSKRQYTQANIWQYNSKQFLVDATQMYPLYESLTSTATPIKINQYKYTTAVTFDETNSYGGFLMDGGPSYSAGNYYGITINFKNGDPSQTFTYVTDLSWQIYDSGGAVDFARYDNDGYDIGYNFEGLSSVQITTTGTPPDAYVYTDAGTKYADLGKGYTVNAQRAIVSTPLLYSSEDYTRLDQTGICNSMVLTFDLDSLANSSWWIGISFEGHSYDDYAVELYKETVGGVAHWYYRTYGDADPHELYHDSSLSANTYQLYLNAMEGGEFRYIGNWTDTIAPAPPLLTYEFSYTMYQGGAYPDSIPNFRIYGHTPVMRIDSARVAAYEYRIIQNATYNPATFRQNPVTQLSEIAEYGTTLVFGGETYTITSGKITLGSGVSVPLNNMRLSSTKNDDNKYTNTINGYYVSTTNAPSTITFNGDWSMRVYTDSQTAKIVDNGSMKWIPGGFAWNGVDSNFWLMGLFTCGAAFVGIGLYAKSKGMSIMPLVLVCACAGIMFLLLM